MRPTPDQALHPSAIRIWRLRGASQTAAICSALFVALSAVDHPSGALICAAMLCALAFAGWTIGIAPGLGWRRWRYGLGNHELEISHGFLSARHTVVPLARVQHVTSTQNRISRMFGLSSVVVFTSAGPHEIPLLAVSVANALQMRLTELAREAREAF